MSRVEELIQKLCPNGVEWKCLGELGKFIGGLTGKTKNDFKNGNEKYITYKNVFDNLKVNLNNTELVSISDKEKQNSMMYGDVIFTVSSETREESGMSSVITEKIEGKLFLNSFCVCFRFNDLNVLLPEFSKYLFRSDAVRNQIKKIVNGATRFNLSREKMLNIKIPIPPLEEQERIVKILDRFEKLCNDISEGLPAEIEGRRKQYEYYRDKLLTFKEK